MCGIVAVLQQPAARPAPDPDAVLAALADAADRLAGGDLATLGLALEPLQEVDRLLRGTPGLRCLLSSGDLTDRIKAATAQIGAQLSRLEADLDGGLLDLPPSRQEEINATLVGLKDVRWAIERDRLGLARAVADLAPAGVADEPAGATDGPAGATDGPVGGWWAIQVALSSLDRLEVRGRDSAGIHVLVAGSGLDVPEDRRGRLLELRLQSGGRDR